MVSALQQNTSEIPVLPLLWKQPKNNTDSVKHTKVTRVVTLQKIFFTFFYSAAAQLDHLYNSNLC